MKRQWPAGNKTHESNILSECTGRRPFSGQNQSQGIPRRIEVSPKNAKYVELRERSLKMLCLAQACGKDTFFRLALAQRDHSAVAHTEARRCTADFICRVIRREVPI